MDQVSLIHIGIENCYQKNQPCISKVSHECVLETYILEGQVDICNYRVAALLKSSRCGGSRVEYEVVGFFVSSYIRLMGYFRLG